jgi:DNA invertase Pin-like site-specific DNA recombinase
MARKSRKDLDKDIVTESVDFEIPIYSTALYIRLSIEDNKKRGNSVESQKSILENHVALNPELKVFDTYIDNGTTGTNFERPAFQRMMADVEAGKVNCIIVKDLSRLGRNAIDTGYYVEKYFPVNHIRFIAVTDRFDSDSNDNINGGIILPMKNMINEAYSLDIGRKIKAQARQSMNDGQYIGARPPYGYLKDARDCHRLIIDPETAPVVRQIFEWAYEKAGLNTIVKRLNDAGIVSPSHHKKQTGLITHENLIGSGKWQTFTVNKILCDEVYTGDMVQGKSKIVDHRQVPVSRDKWITVRDTHEPIIIREIFDAVQAHREQVAANSVTRAKDPYSENIFKGKVFCSHCGKPLHRQRNTRRTGPDVYYLHCIANSRIAKGTCPGVMVDEREVKDKLAQYLRHQAVTPTGESLLTRQNDMLLKERRGAVSSKTGRLRQDIGNKQRFLNGLYENLVNGILTRSEYFSMKADYEKQITAIMGEIAALEKGLKDFEAETSARADWTNGIRQISCGAALTAELMNRLVDRIEIGSDKTLHVTCLSEAREGYGHE